MDFSKQNESRSSQVLPPGLWVVATPIGNLRDMTPRARDALQDADFILCEDTRRTSVLLTALQISRTSTHLHRLDAHTEVNKIESWVDHLLEGKSIALVTDAGTPGISDPGALLVNRAQSRGVEVTPVPGPSAVVTLLSMSGFQETSFTFRGFFPRASQEQVQELRSAKSNTMSRVFMWFESPHRMSETLNRVEEVAPEVQMIVGKELTKIHEKFFSGDAKSVASAVRQELEREGSLGEWCFAIQFPKKSDEELQGSDENEPWRKALRCLLGAQIPPSDAAKRVSQEFGTPKKRVYEAALQISGKKTAEWG